MYSEAAEPHSQQAQTGLNAGTDAPNEGQLDIVSDVFYDQWLATQAGQLHSCQGALLVSVSPQGLQPLALWPDESVDLAPLGSICEEVARETCALAMALPAPDDGLYVLAAPAQQVDNGELIAVCAVLIRATSDDDPVLVFAMEQLHWGSAWLALQHTHTRLQQETRSHARAVTAGDLLAGVLSEADFHAAGSRLVNECSDLLNCDRVAYGDLRSARAKVRLISHNAQVSRRMNLVRAIEAAMDEARDQHRSLVWPPATESDALILKSSEELASLGGGSVLIVPVYFGDTCVAAMAFERGSDQVFDADEISYAEAISALAAPALEEKRLNDRWLITKTWFAGIRQLKRLLGPGYLGRKLTVLGLAAVLIFFSTYHAEYNLAADSTLEGRIQRAIIAPFDGYIADAPRRAGDTAKAGDELARLDDRDLRLERLKWLSEQAQLQRQLQEARGKRENARVKVINAQLDKTAAELELVENRLQRSRISAPISGLIIDGDLSQRMGAAVSQGETLFLMTPLDNYRIRMRVPERRVNDVQVGQAGELKLSSVPDERFAFKVTRLTPQAIVQEGETFFRVDAELKKTSQRLQPGMEGVAKIHVDERLLIKIWSRDLLEWLRMQWWGFWG